MYDVVYIVVLYETLDEVPEAAEGVAVPAVETTPGTP